MAADFSSLILEGRLALPGDADWDSVRQPWNLLVDQRPAAVAQVASAADVAAVVDFAREAGLRVTGRGTGHMAAAVPDLSDAIIVATSALDEIAVDPEGRTVRLGAGVVWADAAAALAEHGLAALAGAAPDVGVVGYTLGGGLSWLSRSFGVAAGSVLAVELVTADGVLRRVDADREPELFWAVRGGGGHFGIVTALELRVFPVPELVAGMMLWPIERAPEILPAYSAWCAAAPDAASGCARLLRFPPIPEIPEPLRGRRFVGIDGAILDAALPQDSAADALLAPLRALGPELDTWGPMPPSRLAEVHLDPPGPSAGDGDGLVIGGFGPDAIDALLAVAGPDADLALIVVDVRHLGGAVARPVPGGGVVDHFDGEFQVWATGAAPTPELAARVHAEVAGVIAALEPWRVKAGFPNETDLYPTDPERLYPQLERLRAIKAAVDPGGLITGAHPLG